MADAPRSAHPQGVMEEIRVAAGEVELPGRLDVPDQALGTVVFVHGSGSSRHSPRNRRVAAALNRAGLGTFLFDLLTPAEAGDRAAVFDIGLLARRLSQVTGELCRRPEVAGLPVGYFGASTGAAAALWAAAEPDGAAGEPDGTAAGKPRPEIAAIVSRGGRPDLAGPKLPAVRAPTLLIVGGADEVVLGLNRLAQQRLRCVNRLEVVPGATHLFEEPGALDTVAELARDWFTAHFTARRAVR